MEMAPIINVILYHIVGSLWIWDIDQRSRIDGRVCSVEFTVSILVQWPETSISEGSQLFFTTAVFLLYSGFPVLFPLDHSVVPFLKNVGRFHGPETTRCSILCQMFWTYYAFNICFIKLYRRLARFSSQMLHSNLSDRLCRPFKAVREMETYRQWHGGSNWLDS